MTQVSKIDKIRKQRRWRNRRHIERGIIKPAENKIAIIEKKGLLARLKDRLLGK